ncbi:branched-chain amino acid transporter permease [Castellaniella sp.]|uniref:branched-chain amino acid transporter permease n=1 Tax=Castellaniella sp. TaxID=1955812 RepID=UPI00355F6D85
MNDVVYLLAAIGLMALITWLLRALPFMAGHWLRHHPLVHKLGGSLPLAIMVLLLVDTAASQARHHPGLPWPECAAVVVVVLLQWRLRQTLLSIVAGTATYMLLLGL